MGVGEMKDLQGAGCDDTYTTAWKWFRADSVDSYALCLCPVEQALDFLHFE